jgi:hypothetical protein
VICNETQQGEDDHLAIVAETLDKFAKIPTSLQFLKAFLKIRSGQK